MQYDDILKNVFKNENSEEENMKKKEFETGSTQNEGTGKKTEDIIAISLKDAVTGEQFTLDLPSDVRMKELLPAIAEKLKINNGSDFTLMNAIQDFQYQPDDTFISTKSENFDFCILNYNIDKRTVEDAARQENKNHQSGKDEENRMKSFKFEEMTFFVYKELNNAIKKEEKDELGIIISQYSTLLEENERLKKQISENNTINHDLQKTQEQLEVTKKELYKTKDELNKTRNKFDCWRKDEKISKILSFSSIILVIMGIVIVIPPYTKTIGTMTLFLGLLLSLVSALFHKLQRLYGTNHDQVLRNQSKETE
jgi:hypothetical protein